MRKGLLILPIALVALLTLSTVSPAARAVTQARPAPGTVKLDPALPVHPYLQYGAQAEPDKVVRLLVQKKSGAADSKEIARSIGATVDEEFPLIKTMVIEAKQKLALALAHNPNVLYITPDAPVKRTAVNTANLKTSYPGTLGIPQIWNGSVPATGKGVTVAVMDSGVNRLHPDIANNLVAVVVNKKATGTTDANGHGTHVTGIIKGVDALGRYIGVAPDARVISVQIADDLGRSQESDVIRGLQWVYEYRNLYSIRAVNLSVSGSVPTSYLNSPIDAAAEQLWLGGVTVVVSSGNRGAGQNTAWYPPGNDPFVLTVGATDDNSTVDPADDSIAGFSSRGWTQDGFYKPDLVAPGRRIVAPLAGPNVTLAQLFPDRITDANYIRLSGTSMSAPVVTGVVALLLEKYPTLTPNQMKWLLTTTASTYPNMPDNAGQVNPVAAFAAAPGPLGQANQGLTINTGISTSTGTVQWGQSYWDQSYWDQSYWDESAYDVFDGD